MRVFFYVQHLLGVGHLQRAATLCAALRAYGFEVVLASGGMPLPGIAVDVQLPPARAADLSFRNLVDERGTPIDDAWQRRRTTLLLDAWRAARATVLVIELFPFGRRQMRFELLPLLEDARRLAPRPLVVCSVRDLIQPRPEREAEAVELVERFFDHVLVHGDPRLVGFERTFGSASRLGSRLRSTMIPGAAARESARKSVSLQFMPAMTRQVAPLRSVRLRAAIAVSRRRRPTAPPPAETSTSLPLPPAGPSSTT